jgi:hypothetical protein
MKQEITVMHQYMQTEGVSSNDFASSCGGGQSIGEFYNIYIQVPTTYMHNFINDKTLLAW